MEYRTHKKTQDKISAIGLGSVSGCNEKESAEIITSAYENGINYFDMAAPDNKAFPSYGAVLSSVRKQIMYQIHFGINLETGVYGWTTELDTIKRNLDWQLKTLKTDYIDYGFIHCIDQESDLADYEKNGSLAFLIEMKKQGVVHHIGLSSHTPALAQKVLDMGIVETLMFSINPGYDYHQGEFANGSVDERMALYNRCAAEGIGITVMKPFSGGQLLDASLSPFGKALTDYQCLQYALDKPAVLTVLPGICGMEQLRHILGYLTAEPREKDYSVIGTFAPSDANGKCVYCSHCHPCPAGLDIALINKYYDLAKAGDTLAKGHYEKLKKKAGDCISCGHCDQRCPFHVKQSARMEEIRSYFGK